MTKSKQKGTAAETEVVRYLRSFDFKYSGPPFPDVERRALSGEADRGDIAGVRNTVIEVKAVERPALAAWQRETLRERDNAGVQYCVLVVKRKYKPTWQWDAYMPVRQLGYPCAWTPREDSWVRMDLVLAVAYMAMWSGLESPSNPSSPTTA